MQVPVIEIESTPSRFCQQCGRFHPLAEFDGSRRSCRAKLDAHNARRKAKRAKAAAERAGVWPPRAADLVGAKRPRVDAPAAPPPLARPAAIAAPVPPDLLARLGTGGGALGAPPGGRGRGRGRGRVGAPRAPTRAAPPPPPPDDDSLLLLEAWDALLRPPPLPPPPAPSADAAGRRRSFDGAALRALRPPPAPGVPDPLAPSPATVDRRTMSLAAAPGALGAADLRRLLRGGLLLPTPPRGGAPQLDGGGLAQPQLL